MTRHEEAAATTPDGILSTYYIHTRLAGTARRGRACAPSDAALADAAGGGKLQRAARRGRLAVHTRILTVGTTLV